MEFTTRFYHKCRLRRNKSFNNTSGTVSVPLDGFPDDAARDRKVKEIALKLREVKGIHKLLPVHPMKAYGIKVKVK